MKRNTAMLLMIGAMAFIQVNCGTSPDQAIYALTDAGGGGGGSGEGGEGGMMQMSSGTTEPDAGVMEDASIDVFDAGQWTPQSLTGLVLWLDGSQGVDNGSGTVDKWADQSGKMNDATAVSLGTNAPLLVPSSIGGNPAVHFDGTNYLVINDSDSMQFGVDDFVIAIAARHTTPTSGTWGYGLFFAKYEKAIPYIGPVIVGNTEARTTEVQVQVSYKNAEVMSAQSGLNNDNPMVILMRRKASGGAFSFELRLNGAPAGIGAGNAFAVNVSAPGRSVYIAGTPDVQNIVGDIAEVVAVKGVTADGDVLALEGYLKTKYGL